MYRLAKRTRKGLHIGLVEYASIEDARARQSELKAMGITMVIVQGFGDKIIK